MSRSATALKDVHSAENLVNRSSVGTRGARQLAARAHPDAVVSVLDRVEGTRPASLPTPTPEQYQRLESLPRPKGRLTKEDLDPLVEEAGAGNPAAIHDLLRMIEPVVVRYCRARMGGRDLSYLSADDVAQEVCLAVLAALPAYQDQGRPFLAFVYGIAQHKVADAHRAAARNRAEPVRDLPELPAAGDEPESNAIALELNTRLNKILGMLPVQWREVVVLRVVVGLSATETADALGMTPGAVRVTQHRALSRLRPLLQAEVGTA